MKVALVHDYLSEFGGAERVLLAMTEIWPEAPIYTAFARKDSPAYKRFEDKQLIESWAAKIPGFRSKLHSPLRFLAPYIWESFTFEDYDLVVTSASWYITKGVITKDSALNICYCHTPPRYLYGYPTSVEWQKYWMVRQYAKVVNNRLRQYDYLSAQRVDYFIANSQNTRERINKFYRREADVIYPPVELVGSQEKEKGNYYLVISRIVGGKGLSLAVEAANKLRVPLKVVGAAAGWSGEMKKLKEAAGGTVEFLGYLEDEELAGLYRGAKGFLALASDEDFGITPVESMMAGTPVVAFRGGGYQETVLEGKTGVFVDELTAESVASGIRKLEEKGVSFSPAQIRKHGEKFGKERFKKEMVAFVEEKLRRR